MYRVDWIVVWISRLSFALPRRSTHLQRSGEGPLKKAPGLRLEGGLCVVGAKEGEATGASKLVSTAVEPAFDDQGQDAFGAPRSIDAALDWDRGHRDGGAPRIDSTQTVENRPRGLPLHPSSAASEGGGTGERVGGGHGAGPSGGVRGKKNPTQARRSAAHTRPGPFCRPTTACGGCFRSGLVAGWGARVRTQQRMAGTPTAVADAGRDDCCLLLLDAGFKLGFHTPQYTVHPIAHRLLYSQEGRDGASS